MLEGLPKPTARSMRLMLLLAVPASVCFAVATGVVAYQKSERRDWPAIETRVVSSERWSTRDAAVRLRYQVAGKEYTASDIVHRAYAEIGLSLHRQYNPKNPAELWHATGATQPWEMAAMAVMAGVVATFAFVKWRHLTRDAGSVDEA